MWERHSASRRSGSRRRFLSSLATVASTAVLAACGVPSSQPPSGETALGSAATAPGTSGTAPVSVEWWDSYTGVEAEAAIDLIAACEAANPGISIQRTYIASDQNTQSNQQLLTAIAGGGPPDLCKFDRFIVAQFAAQEFLTDLTDLAEQSGVSAADYTPFAWEEASHAGRLYALPFDISTRALWYNKQHFREVGLDPESPPSTVAELDEYADLLSSGRQTRYGFIPIADQGSIYTYGWAWGGEFQDAATQRITTAHPRVVEAMGWLQSFAQQFGVDRLDAFAAACASNGCLDARDPLWTGQLAMVIGSNSRLVQARRYASDVDYGVAPIPGPDGPAPQASWAGGWSWVIPRGAKQPEAAWQVLRWLCGPEGQSRFCRATLSFPSHRATAADPAFGQDPQARLLRDLLPQARIRPITPASSLLWDELVKARDDIVHGEPPAARLAAVDERVNAELEKMGFFEA